MLTSKEVGVTMNMSLHGIENLKKLLIYAKDASTSTQLKPMPVSTEEFDVFMGMLDQLILEGHKFRASPEAIDESLEPDTKLQ